ncbi:sugar ABC transporter ATP-binding protein [Roseicitreum antarcticum]|uniref:sugar ABC transporter ATP-binding protein n=1 Tax=Roseicitreum antarcticum TaxID=564137 RepID=UPI00159FE700|nr:sugar ABC transporter ATP-binding protein [Roseicitreum antarcticum]
MSTPILALSQVSRSFGPIEVLHSVDIALHPGRVHALIGENGAGKSTMMKIMTGYQPPSAGRVLLDGAPVTFTDMGQAEAQGISLIHQEFNLAEQLTVEQNIFLGAELRRGWLLDKAAMRAKSRELLARLRCDVDPLSVISTLSNSDKQMVEIAKALLRDTRILIMDEPTAVLTRTETEVLLEQVRALRDHGTAVLFTSHKLDEVSAIADDLTIMRDGAVVWSGPARDMDEHQMAEAMVGREISTLYPPKTATQGALALEVEGFRVPGFAQDIGFTLRKGEILGVAGLMGSGRTETFEGLAGLRPGHGVVRIDGAPVTIRHPWEALAMGLAYLTEDRKTRGLLLQKGLGENLTLQALHRFSNWLLDKRAEDAALTRAVADFDIRGSRDVDVGSLSGGNQQKLLFAKIMLSDPGILVIDEPTRGIDIGTKQQMYQFIRKLAAEGRAIIVISSEMQEVIGLADRVLVMRQGRIAGELAGPEMTEDAIVRLAMGVGAAAPATGNRQKETSE